MTMKAMILRESGEAESFELKEVDRPKIRAGHILVEVRATSVNPIDTKVRTKEILFMG